MTKPIMTKLIQWQLGSPGTPTPGPSATARPSLVPPAKPSKVPFVRAKKESRRFSLIPRDIRGDRILLRYQQKIGTQSRNSRSHINAFDVVEENHFSPAFRRSVPGDLVHLLTHQAAIGNAAAPKMNTREATSAADRGIPNKVSKKS